MFDSNNSFCDLNLKSGKMLAGACLFRGDFTQSEVDETLARVRDHNSSNFIEWIPDSLMSSSCKQGSEGVPASGALLANTTSIADLFARNEKHTVAMWRRRVFAHTYEAQGMDF